MNTLILPYFFSAAQGARIPQKVRERRCGQRKLYIVSQLWYGVDKFEAALEKVEFAPASKNYDCSCLRGRILLTYFTIQLMNKADIINAVHGKLGTTQRAAEEVVNTVFDAITQSLSKGEEVAISGFGAFAVRKREARMGVNPRTGQKIQIAATVTPKFKAGKALKDAVK